MNAHSNPDRLRLQSGAKPYIDAALTLLPLHKWDAPDGKGKAPRDSKWTRTAYDSKAVLAEAVRTGINVGVRPGSRFLIIDCDPRNGGHKSFAAFCKAHGLIPETLPLVLTGGGGFHYFVRLPKDAPKLRKKLREYPGIEFLSGDGAQAVCAGSRHPSGKFYEWAEDFEDRPALKDAPILAANIVDALARPSVEDMESDAPDLEAASPEVVAEVLDTLDVTAFRDQQDWQDFMMATVAVSDGEAVEEFIAWSITDPLYADDAERIRDRWKSTAAKKPGGITGKSFYWIAREHGAPQSVLSKLLPERPAASAREAFGDDSEDFVDDTPADDDEFESDGGGTAAAVVGVRVNRNSVAADSFDNAMAAVMECGFLPKFNELTLKVEFREGRMPDSITQGGELTDNVVRVIRDHLVMRYQGNAYNPSKENVREAVMTIALRNRFNPLLDYINGLEWDGTERLAGLFGDYFKCGDSDYVRGVSLCFGIGAVRRARHPGSKFDTMPVVKGPQGWNKSTGVRALFGADYYTDAAVDIRSKDAAMVTRGIWVLEVAELDAMRRQEAVAFKAWLARASDRQRDPFGAIVEEFRRSWVAIGTTNESGYLRDASGARRFWPLTITAPVDVGRLKADRDQLWAEAAAREARGESDVLPKKLWAKAGEHQKAETSDDPWVDLIRDFLTERSEPISDDDDEFNSPTLPPDRVFASDIYDALDIDAAKRTREQGQRMRTVMEQRLGWTYKEAVRIHGQVRSGYVREREADL
jgi:predicted P-loop ATPase